MSDEATEAEPTSEPEEETSEPGRIAGGFVLLILTGVALLILRAIVTVAPYTAYFVAGVLACLGWQKARGWLGRRRGEQNPEPQPEPEKPDVGAALWALAGDGRHVLLTELRDQLGAADTKTVRALLDEAGIPVRSGVRAPTGNGPGVHRDDLPPLSPAESGHGECCCCRSGANANTNNDSGEGPGEGLRVEDIGQSGTVIYHPADAARHHNLPRAGRRTSS